MLRWISASLVVLALLVVAGCAAPTPDVAPPDQAPVESPTTGARLAPGLYALEDGTAQAMGTLEYQDLEGGFWAIVGGTEAEGNVGDIVAVIANGSDFETQLEALDGKTVLATGTRLDGASIRMAGPEVEITKIEEVSDTPGAAE